MYATNSRDSSWGNRYFKHKIGGGVFPTSLTLPWIRQNFFFFRLSQEGQSNRDRARCQRNQLMQLATTEIAITYHNNLSWSLQNFA